MNRKQLPHVTSCMNDKSDGNIIKITLFSFFYSVIMISIWTGILVLLSLYIYEHFIAHFPSVFRSHLLHIYREPCLQQPHCQDRYESTTAIYFCFDACCAILNFCISELNAVTRSTCIQRTAVTFLTSVNSRSLNTLTKII